MRTECIHVIEGKKSIVLNYCFGVAINNVTTMLQQCYRHHVYCYSVFTL